jgi:hypothetical protein
LYYLWVTLERDLGALGLLEYLRLGGDSGLRLLLQLLVPAKALLVARGST